MAISRSLMNRQLQADGGIMNLSQEGIGGGDYKGQDMGSRTGFNILKKVGKRVRKLIPNEISSIAVKAAPFVAPFNPALAGAMAGIGSFDQTGNFGDAFKRGALTYGGGQAARYVGGAGFQGNPFTSGAFTPSGFTSGFSSPLGSDTGLGKFFSNRGTEGVQGIDMATGGADGVGVIQDAPTKALASELSYVPETSIDMVTGGADGVGIIQDTIIDKSTVAKEPGFLKNMFDGISNQDYGKVAKTIGDGAKKFGKAMFTKADGSIDKAAVMGAVAFAGSYAEALALANDAGVELTEEAYDEARKSEKQEEYAGYLTNFFGGQKDGGRIGLKFGTKPEEAEVGIMTIDVEAGDDDDMEDMKMAGITFSSAEKSYLFRKLGGAGGSDRSFTMPQLYRVLSNPDRYAEDAAVLKEIAIMGLGKKDGGRIGLKDGTDKSMLEKFLDSKLVQEGRYGASEFFFGDPIMFGTPDKFKDGKNDNRGTFKRDPSDYDKLSPEKQAYIEAFLNSDEGQLFLKPGKIKFPTDERMREHNKKITLEDFNEDRNPLELLLGIDYENRAKGGRIGYKYGSGASNRVAQLILERDYLLSKDEDVSYIDAELESLGYKMRSEGGIMEAKVPTGQIRKNNAGVTERDYREEGGFVPVGIKERADDVPAMLSKNEFVMTADAVRGIGNGSVEEGSKKLYNTMKQAEQVGKA